MNIFEKDWENSKKIDLSDEGILADREKHAAKALAEIKAHEEKSQASVTKSKP